jgi:hypothetical protein
MSLDAVQRCLRAGVREFVICAGARNAALIEALARAETAGFARLWRHFEERSAGFFALGRTMETGTPCAVVTTSGTAAAELLPSVIEAFYQNRPLVALTADRPASFRGSGAPQCIEQPGIFGPYAFQGPLPEWNGKTPIHLNIELDETFTPHQPVNVSHETFTGEPVEAQGNGGFSTEDVGIFVSGKDRVDVATLARWLREDWSRTNAKRCSTSAGITACRLWRKQPAVCARLFTVWRSMMRTVFSKQSRQGRSCVWEMYRAVASGATLNKCRTFQSGRSAGMACGDSLANRMSHAVRLIA